MGQITSDAVNGDAQAAKANGPGAPGPPLFLPLRAEKCLVRPLLNYMYDSVLFRCFRRTSPETAPVRSSLSASSTASDELEQTSYTITHSIFYSKN